MAPRPWIKPPPVAPEAAAIARELGISPVVAALLANRGCRDATSAARFLAPDLDQCHPPDRLPDVGVAAERLAAALRAGERILVHGDYDADGICAAALLTRALRRLRRDTTVEVTAWVPERRDGYDLSVETVRRAAAAGFRLVVTADCGCVAFEAAAAARELGVDLVITDHHEPRPELPPAVAVVNPKRHDSRYPFRELCGTGVAYKLVWALLERLGKSPATFRRHYAGLVSLATVADCVPLLDENRALVHAGLGSLSETRHPGLRALVEQAFGPGSGAGGNGAERRRRLTTYDLGFLLAPRLNAAGRMGSAADALALLLAEDEQEAAALASQLEALNGARQAEQERILADATRMALQRIADPVLVLASPNWHAGVVGIVAGKLAETYARPTFLIALDAETGLGRGSARTPGGAVGRLWQAFDVTAALAGCADLLLRFGGHAQAAGFEVAEERIDSLRRRLCEASPLAEVPLDAARPIAVDGVVPASEVGLRLAEEIARMEPFGHGNPEPILRSEGLELVSWERLPARSGGAPDDHLKLRLRAGGAPLEAVMWRSAARADELAGIATAGRRAHLALCYALKVEEYYSATIGDRLRTARLEVRDFRPCE